MLTDSWGPADVGLWLDFVVLAGATVAGITASSLLLPPAGAVGHAKSK
jgi:hypothetical protein